MIIVTKLTTKVNQVTIQAYDEYVDGYWLKLHRFASFIGFDGFDKLQKY